MIYVKPIENGTVIDHLPTEAGFKVLRALGGLDGYTFILASDVDSKKLGKKDLLKIENKELKKSEYDVVSLFAPEATINIIENGKIVKKSKVQIPNEITGILECNNPNCVTKTESFYLEPKFKVLSKKPLKIKCEYCDSILDSEKALKKIRNKD